MAAEAGGAGAGAGAGEGGAPGSGGGNVQPGGGAPPQGQQQPGVAGQGGSAFTYQEDRSKWVDPNQVSKTIQQRLNEQKGSYEQKLQELSAQLEQERKRIQALAGVNPQSPEDAQAEEIRQALFKIEPRLAKILESLDDEKLEKVLAAADNGDLVRQTNDAHWTRHADTMLTNLRDTVADKTGLDLTPRQTARLNREFTAHIQAAVRARQVAQQQGDVTYDFQNDVLARYNRGDKALLEEFAKEFLDDWYEPVKKQATTAQARRLTRPVPSGGRTRQTLAQGPPQIDYNNEDAFKEALLKARTANQ